MRCQRLVQCLLAIVTALFLAGQTLYAQMEEVGESALSQVTAQAGITMNMHVHLIEHYGSISISDTDSSPRNRIEFNDVTMSGPDGYFDLRTWHSYYTMDIGTLTNAAGVQKTYMYFSIPQDMNPMNWEVSSVVFCNQEIGSLEIDRLRTVDPTIVAFSGRDEGQGAGIEFEYQGSWTADSILHEYNSSGGSLGFSGLHLAQSINPLTDDPSDPGTWEFTGRFQIGDLLGGTIDRDDDPVNDVKPNPAVFSPGTDALGNTCAYFNLPMKGTARVESVEFGANDFGPMAIDGITVHHLFVRLNPGG